MEKRKNVATTDKSSADQATRRNWFKLFSEDRGMGRASRRVCSTIFSGGEVTVRAYANRSVMLCKAEKLKGRS